MLVGVDGIRSPSDRALHFLCAIITHEYLNQHRFNWHAFDLSHAKMPSYGSVL